MTAPFWFVAAFDRPFRYVAIAEAATAEDYRSSHPGCFDIRGPFDTEFGATTWLNQNQNHWPVYPTAKKKQKKSSGGSGNSGGGNPAPGGGGAPAGGPGGSHPSLPAWFAGVADITGGTVVALVSNDVELLAHEAEVAPGHWQLFPPTDAGQAAANAYVGSPDPKGKATTPGNPITGAIGKAVPGVSGFFGALTQASTWERVGQVLLGLILIAIGLARMTSALPAATKIAKMAGTAAVL